jgi:hypothetical protein
LPKDGPSANPPPSHIFNVPVMVWKQPLTVAGGTVIGVYKDGSPAVVTKTHGKGKAVLFGFLPGQAYLKSALPIWPVDRGASKDSFAHYLPNGMSGHLRARLVDDFLGRGAVTARPVVTSDGLVEATVIDTRPRDGKPGRVAVPLINWSELSHSPLTVTVRGIDTVSAVRSVVRGQLKYTLGKGSLTIEVPLDAADMILIDR